MGDRCYFSMRVLKKDKETVGKIMFGEDWVRYPSGPWCIEDDNGDGTITLIQDEADYGYLDQRQALAEAGMVFEGYHEPGGEYGENVFACFNGKHVQAVAVEAAPVAFVDKDGSVEEDSLKDAKEYYELFEQVEEHFKGTVRQAEPGEQEAYVRENGDQSCATT